MTAGPGGGMDPAKTRILLQRRDLLDRSQRDPAGPRFGCYRRRCGRCLCSREVSAPAPSLRSLRLARFSREGLKAKARRFYESGLEILQASEHVLSCCHLNDVSNAPMALTRPGALRTDAVRCSRACQDASPHGTRGSRLVWVRRCAVPGHCRRWTGWRSNPGSMKGRSGARSH